MCQAASLPSSPPLPLPQGLSVDAGARPVGYFGAGIAHRSTALPTHGTTPRRKCPGIALRPEEEKEEVEEEGPASAWRTYLGAGDTNGTWLLGHRSTGSPSSPRRNPPLPAKEPCPRNRPNSHVERFLCQLTSLPGEEMIRVSFNRTLISWAPHRNAPGTGISSGVGKGTRDLSGKHLSYLCQHTRGEQR